MGLDLGLAVVGKIFLALFLIRLVTLLPVDIEDTEEDIKK